LTVLRKNLKSFRCLQMACETPSIWENQRVWLTFKADLAEKDNGLTADLRAALISLALWVENHTKAVLSGSKNVKPLIDINRSIIDGLSGRAAKVAAE